MKVFKLFIFIVLSSFSCSIAQSSFDWPEMVEVRGGVYMMGAIKKDHRFAQDDEIPAHKVSVDDFFIGRYEVSVYEWKEYCKSTGRAMPEMPKWGWIDDYPMCRVTWTEAVEFCNWLSGEHGFQPAYSFTSNGFNCDFESNGYRLPTEAEWEYAAQGGLSSEGYRFSGSNDLNEISWHIENSRDTPHGFGSKKGNELGIYDMCGNVWEWCWDYYKLSHYKDVRLGRVEDLKAQGPKTGNYRVVKGGAYSSKKANLRLSNKNRSRPTSTYDFYGFRLSRSKVGSD